MVPNMALVHEQFGPWSSNPLFCVGEGHRHEFNPSQTWQHEKALPVANRSQRRALSRHWWTAYSPCLLDACSPSTSSACGRAAPSSPLLVPASDHLGSPGLQPLIVLSSGRTLANRSMCILWLADTRASLPWPPLPLHVAPSATRATGAAPHFLVLYHRWKGSGGADNSSGGRMAPTSGPGRGVPVADKGDTPHLSTRPSKAEAEESCRRHIQMGASGSG
ncbi:hypothetical protein D1007_02890 [Hordeum vulgare]|nr:hypothetical protein D1007_02890 [Hordeum vulgare]